MANKPGHEHGEPFASGHLSVGTIHRVYYEHYGKKDGKPVIVLHGGPGGGTNPGMATFFNPDVYHVILFDQRGAGKSTPVAELRENTTQHLIEDIETLRRLAGIDKWHMVFGGSWGSTLALAYAQAHPGVVGSLVLRGILLGAKEEFDVLYRGHVSDLFFPEEYAEFMDFLPEHDRGDPLLAYHKLMTSDDMKTKLAAGKAFNKLEMKLSQLVAPPDLLEKLDDDDWVLAHAGLETHYFTNDCFLTPGQLLDEKNVEAIRHIPSM